MTLGHEKATELLVRNGTNTNVANKDGITALMAAVQTGNLKPCYQRSKCGFLSSSFLFV